MVTQKSASCGGPIGYFTTCHCGEETQLQLTVVVDSKARAAWANDMISCLPLLGETADIIVIEHRNAAYDSRSGEFIYNN